MKKLNIIVGLIALMALNANAQTKFDVDLYGGIASDTLNTGRGAVGARGTFWFDNNIGVGVGAEVDKYNSGLFVDRSVAYVAYRLTDLTKTRKLVPELRLGGGYNFESGNPISEVTVGGRYYITKNISFGSEAGPRLEFKDRQGDWSLVARAFVSFGF